jgi:hypothetical protein
MIGLELVAVGQEVAEDQGDAHVRLTVLHCLVLLAL